MRRPSRVLRKLAGTLTAKSIPRRVHWGRRQKKAATMAARKTVRTLEKTLRVWFIRVPRPPYLRLARGPVGFGKLLQVSGEGLRAGPWRRFLHRGTSRLRGYRARDSNPCRGPWRWLANLQR